MTESVRERERTYGDSTLGKSELHQMTETERERERANEGSIFGYGGFKHCVFESENGKDYNAAVDIARSWALEKIDEYREIHP